ncbi:MAG TPA: HWE histidine kinase domain-containing protein [Xanthobacteraceae bacterium]
MLQGLSEPVRVCHERALEAKRKADATSDPALKASYLDMENGWLVLARSYGFTEGLDNFIAANAAWPLEFDAKTGHQKPDSVLERAGASELFNLLPVAIYVCEPSGLILYYNETAAQLWGRAPKLMDPTDRFCGSYRMWQLDGDPLPHPECPMADVLRTGQPVIDKEIIVERPDGSRGVALVNIRAFMDASGKMLGAVNCFRDITKRQLARDRERLLLRETNHRVKNLLATINAMISLSVPSARTPQELAQSLRGRLAALLRAKELVRPGIMGTEHASERTTVDAIVRTILQPYDDDICRERISASGPDVVVGGTAVTSLALALHEIATNAVKYGALSEPNGAIRIQWETQGDNFRLDWQETGGPVIVAPPKADGFGSTLTERSVTNHLGGKIEYDWRRNGLKLRVTIPLDRLSV